MNRSIVKPSIRIHIWITFKIFNIVGLHGTHAKGVCGNQDKYQSRFLGENKSIIAAAYWYPSGLQVGKLTKNKVEDPTNSSGGGGIDCEDSSSPLIEKNVIIDNEANWGVGIEAFKSSPKIIHNVISGNIVNVSGGGIIILNSDSEISYNTIASNSAKNGGGMHIEFGTPVIYGNIVSANMSSNICGGIRCWGTDAHIVNNMITDNSAVNGAGIMCQESSSPNITNNMVSANSAVDYGGGLEGWNNSSAEVINTILWNNGAPEGSEGRLEMQCTLSISYFDVDGGKSSVFVVPGSTLNWGPVMINANPLSIALLSLASASPLQ